MKRKQQGVESSAGSEEQSRIQSALARATKGLIEERCADGHWIGELSSSALSTATAVCALSVFGKQSGSENRQISQLVENGLRWLTTHANPDGGWGDTDRSFSNLSTTVLCWAAFGSVPGADERYRESVVRTEVWLKNAAGGLQPVQLVPAIVRRYGEDRTFSAPILTMCALAGRLGRGEDGWHYVKQLPFEFGACPHQWFGALGLPVVSYALPALIAIGQVRHHFRPTRNPVTRLLRRFTRKRTLHLLSRLQPINGGFLEATPLTSFVTMSLAAMRLIDHPVTLKGIDFLVRSVREDGSWPIDTNLATWLTTLAVNALAENSLSECLPVADRKRISDWLLGQQYRVEHPYTHAAPGGWAWTHLPGGVPDADDTSSALLALHNLTEIDETVLEAAEQGVTWLLNLQNRDGGIPTFCKGWGKLPFDRSSPDLTAHAIRAWSQWQSRLPAPLQNRLRRAINHGGRYLKNSQRADGSWVPLWFGNQHAPSEENPTYGTSRVLICLQELAVSQLMEVKEVLARGTRWLIEGQNPDGGWSGSQGGPSSVEETAWALQGLAGSLRACGQTGAIPISSVQRSIRLGIARLIEESRSGGEQAPSPIGFYFAKLWYYERLYPMIFTVGALGQVAMLQKQDLL